MYVFLYQADNLLTGINSKINPSLGKGQRGVEVCLSEGKVSPYENALLGLYFCLYIFPMNNGALAAGYPGSMVTYIPVSLAG